MHSKVLGEVVRNCLGALVGRTAILLVGLVIGSSSNCVAQNSPAVKVHAYERDVVGGIPGGPGARARQTRYLIYLETLPRTDFTIEGVWMHGQYYSVETAVKKTPVRFESPVTLAQSEQSIAVPETPNTVTEIVVKEPVPGKTQDPSMSRSLGESQTAVQLSYLGKSVLVPIKQFEKRGPLYLP